MACHIYNGNCRSAKLARSQWQDHGASSRVALEKQVYGILPEPCYSHGSEPWAKKATSDMFQGAFLFERRGRGWCHAGPLQLGKGPAGFIRDTHVGILKNRHQSLLMSSGFEVSLSQQRRIFSCLLPGSGLCVKASLEDGRSRAQTSKNRQMLSSSITGTFVPREHGGRTDSRSLPVASRP